MEENAKKCVHNVCSLVSATVEISWLSSRSGNLASFSPHTPITARRCKPNPCLIPVGQSMYHSVESDLVLEVQRGRSESVRYLYGM